MHRVLSVLRVYFCFCLQSLENVDKTIIILFLRIHEFNKNYPNSKYQRIWLITAKKIANLSFKD